jgi:cobalamin biosynthesis Mg chelatase CobN
MELSAPMIPLTLRAMNRTPHLHARGLRLPSAALFSVLVLLAFGSFPVFAEANATYEPEPTTLPGEAGSGGTPSHHNNPGGSESSPGAAKQSTAPNAGSGTQHSQNGSSNSHDGASGGTNPSSPAGGSKTQGESGKSAVGSEKSLGSVQLGEPKSAASDSGGPSPLVPILIAVAVLAAISVGAVMVRQRRGDAGGFSLKRG